MHQVENISRRRLFRGKIPPEKAQIRLPWIISEQHFTQHCNQCLDCIPVCETQIVQTDERGFPSLNFSKNECTQCGKCQQACSESLFLEDSKKLTSKA